MRIWVLCRLQWIVLTFVHNVEEYLLFSGLLFFFPLATWGEADSESVAPAEHLQNHGAQLRAAEREDLKHKVKALNQSKSSSLTLLIWNSGICLGQWVCSQYKYSVWWWKSIYNEGEYVQECVPTGSVPPPPPLHRLPCSLKAILGTLLGYVLFSPFGLLSGQELPDLVLISKLLWLKE